MDYYIDIPFRGTKTMLIKNCKSAAGARRKLLDFDNGQPDCEGIAWDIDRVFYKRGKMYPDRKGHKERGIDQ